MGYTYKKIKKDEVTKSKLLLAKDIIDGIRRRGKPGFKLPMLTGSLSLVYNECKIRRKPNDIDILIDPHQMNKQFLDILFIDLGIPFKSLGNVSPDYINKIFAYKCPIDYNKSVEINFLVHDHVEGREVHKSLDETDTCIRCSEPKNVIHAKIDFCFNSYVPKHEKDILYFMKHNCLECI